MAALARGPLHGYAIMAHIYDKSDGRLDFPEGSLYPALYKLEKGGLVTSQWHTAGGRRRRVYKLSSQGLAALEQATGQWQKFAGSVSKLLEKFV